MQLTVSLDTNFVSYRNVKQLQVLILRQAMRPESEKLNIMLYKISWDFIILQFLDSKVSF